MRRIVVVLMMGAVVGAVVTGCGEATDRSIARVEFPSTTADPASSPATETVPTSTMAPDSSPPSPPSSAAPAADDPYAVIGSAVHHFDTPEESMRYLVGAYNAHDLVALKHVTTESARIDLEDMRSEAANLRFDHCTANTERGDYDCYFTHDYPPGYQGDHANNGTAGFTVGPADRPGWYMTVLEYCG